MFKNLLGLEPAPPPASSSLLLRKTFNAIACTALFKFFVRTDLKSNKSINQSMYSGRSSQVSKSRVHCNGSLIQPCENLWLSSATNFADTCQVSCWEDANLVAAPMRQIS